MVSLIKRRQLVEYGHWKRRQESLSSIKTDGEDDEEIKEGNRKRGLTID